MKYLKTAIITLTSYWTLVLTAKTTLAFSIAPYQPNPESGYLESKTPVYNRSDGRFYKVYTVVKSLDLISQIGGTNFLWRELENFSRQHQNFEFLEASSEFSLLGQIQVSELAPCIPTEGCGPDAQQGLVGADVKFDYIKHNEDPVESFDLRWIQVVNTDNDAPPGLLFGVPSDGLDTGSNTATPFYYNFFKAFEDTPTREDWKYHWDWTAELYLAEVKRQERQQVVTIYNGFTWGWASWAIPLDCRELKDASGSGGGGVDKEGCRDFDKGQTQDEPLQEDASFEEWKLFFDVPGNLWYDPTTNYGFEFQSIDDTLFTDILDFPLGLDADDRFTVSVEEMLLGEFSPGDRVNFVELLGEGVSSFKITGIDSLLGSDEATDIPFKLAFNDDYGSFRLRAFDLPETPNPESVPEPTSVFSLLAFGLLGWKWQRRHR